MDVITLARELGRAIQQEESYKKLHEVQAQADADAELQALIGEFNLKRMNINQEASKKDRDQEKLTTLNKEMREVYSKIMSNENMIAYNEAKADALEQLAEPVPLQIRNAPSRAPTPRLPTIPRAARAAAAPAADAAKEANHQLR